MSTNESNLQFGCTSCVKENYGSINIQRFISKLDACFARNDLEEAEETLEYWYAEGKRLGDKRGLLTVLNEMLGFYRRTGNKEKALCIIEESERALGEIPFKNLGIATVYINLATTVKDFGNPEKAIGYYDIAREIFVKENKTETFEYATLLNNASASYIELQMFDKAEQYINTAIEILTKVGMRDGEIALSYVNLSQLYYQKGDRDGTDSILDIAWEYINSTNQVRDGNYAFILSKCAPVYEFFGRDLEANALAETAEEIYNAGS